MRHAEESEIIEAISDVLEDIKKEQPLPDFVEKRRTVYLINADIC